MFQGEELSAVVRGKRHVQPTHKQEIPKTGIRRFSVQDEYKTYDYLAGTEGYASSTARARAARRASTRTDGSRRSSTRSSRHGSGRSSYAGSPVSTAASSTVSSRASSRSSSRASRKGSREPAYDGEEKRLVLTGGLSERRRRNMFFGSGALRTYRGKPIDPSVPSMDRLLEGSAEAGGVGRRRVVPLVEQAGPATALRAKRLADGADMAGPKAGGQRGSRGDANVSPEVQRGRVRVYGHQHDYFIGDNVGLAPHNDVGKRVPKLGRCMRRALVGHPNAASMKEHERHLARKEASLTARRAQALEKRSQNKFVLADTGDKDGATYVGWSGKG